MKKTALALASAVFVCTASAQAPAAAPDKLTPAQEKELASMQLEKALSTVENLAIKPASPPVIVLERTPAGGATKVAASGTPAAAAPVRPAASQVAPSNFVQKEFALDKTGEDAVKRAREWMQRQNVSADGSGGRVEYVYGNGMPQVVCAPLHVCTIELQPGERVVTEPQIGDSVRWLVTPGSYGEGETKTELVVVKPSEIGLDTNLVLSTNRRMYYLRLVSRKADYTPRVAFTYPDDAKREWASHIAKQKHREANTIPTAGVSSEDLNFNYQVTAEKGDTSFITPIRVFDDGSKTFIQMPVATDRRETPALMVQGADGNLEMVNYRVKGNTYIVDRLLDSAVLVLGVGSDQRRVRISTKRSNGSSWAWGCDRRAWNGDALPCGLEAGQ